VVADAANAVRPEKGEVLAQLCRVDASSCRELVGRDGPHAAVDQDAENTKVCGQPGNSRVRYPRLCRAVVGRAPGAIADGGDTGNARSVAIGGHWHLVVNRIPVFGRVWPRQDPVLPVW